MYVNVVFAPTPGGLGCGATGIIWTTVGATLTAATETTSAEAANGDPPTAGASPIAPPLIPHPPDSQW